MDNQQYYIHHGALSYELDQEHTDDQLTDSEMEQIASSLDGVHHAVHLCCGAGRHVAAFERHGIPSIGIDISPELLKRGMDTMREHTPKPCLVLGDVRLTPIRDRSADCVTLLGNSLCLFPPNQCVRIFSDVARILVSEGVFIMDLPDPAYLKQQGQAPTKMSRTIRTATYGNICWTWVRQVDVDKRLLVSEEWVRLSETTGKDQTKRLCFEFNLYDCEQVDSMSKPYGMRPERLFEYEDVSGRYKGMLRKRTFLVMRMTRDEKI